MKASVGDHKTTTAAHAKREKASEIFLDTTDEKHNGDASKQYQSREDLENAYNEAKKSAARLRKILDTIPTLAWCNLPDGSNDFVNQRWSDYTGRSQEEVKRVGCKVAIHPEDLPKWLNEWRTLVASGTGGEIEGAYAAMMEPTAGSSSE
jgi:PAS domain-containing protein